MLAFASKSLSSKSLTTIARVRRVVAATAHTARTRTSGALPFSVAKAAPLHTETHIHEPAPQWTHPRTLQ